MLLDKSKCYDFFQGTVVNKMRMHQTRSIKDVIFYSIKFKRLNKILGQIQLLKRMGSSLFSCRGNPTYVKLALEEISIQKQLFVFNIEFVGEAIIPKTLTQNNLPQSFQFYNPTLSLIEELCQDHKKTQFAARNLQLLNQVRKDSDVLQNISNFIQTQSQSEK